MRREKKFDAVKMMREIRVKLSEKFSKMTFEEQKKYLEEATKRYHQRRQFKTVKAQQAKSRHNLKEAAR